MSAIASFYLLDRTAIPGLAQAAKVRPVTVPAAKPRFFRRKPTWPVVVLPAADYLEEKDLGVPDEFGWSGYALWYLMGFLEETGTALGTAEYRVETEAVNAVYDQTYLITSVDKRHLAALDPARLDRAAAERYFRERGYDFEEIRQAIHDGLLLLRRLIAALKDSDVLVIHIG